MHADEVYEAARQARDPRFDGRFFVAVRTTGIYCRPVCPVKIPHRRNVTFFPSAAAATEAGYRPCLRCRPETAPGTPAWQGTRTTVSRALRLIGDGALDSGSVETLAERLGVTTRHLSRLFNEYLGASPKAIAQTRRLQFAKRLVDETGLSMTDIAYAAGYGSVRRFNDHFGRVYQRTPSSLRKGSRIDCAQGFRIALRYREPFHFPGILEFLSQRAVPGVEQVSREAYERTIRVDDEAGRLRLSVDPDGDAIVCEVELGNARQLLPVVNRARRFLDLDAVPQDIHDVLNKDPVLAKLVRRWPGQRVPGCWDPFEISVRAIVGQQVSVKGATTVMGRIAAKYGSQSDYGLMFPTPGALAVLDPTSLSMPASRARAIASLADAVDRGHVDLSGATPVAELRQQLVAIKGIGEWTAQYIAMRAVNDPDAFLAGDLVLRQVGESLMGVDQEGLVQRAENWRPWRAYASVYLWKWASEHK